MSDFLDIRTWSILQWVLVVLAAGFIGQFGKSFAKFIMAKVKAMRSSGKTASTFSDSAKKGEITLEMPPVPAGKRDLTPPPPPESAYPVRDVRSAKGIVSGQSAPPAMDKKALKAILKQQKKAAKGSK